MVQAPASRFRVDYYFRRINEGEESRNKWHIDINPRQAPLTRAEMVKKTTLLLSTGRLLQSGNAAKPLFV
jgi:hypothetical protein